MLITDKQALTRYHTEHRIWQGIPGIVHTRGGNTYVSFYSGGTKEEYGNFCALVRAHGDEPFGEPIAVALKEGDYRCFDPAVWIDPLGRLWFFWSVTAGEEVWAAICDDPDADELVWGEERYIGRGILLNKPTVLKNGEWLFPIALWSLELSYDQRRRGQREDDVAGSDVYKTADDGKTFTPLGYAQIHDTLYNEHMVLEQENGVLRMLARLRTGIGESFSYDGGRTWSQGQISELKNPSSRFHICRLRSGRVLLINHYNFSARNNLTALLSDDDGRTFPHHLLLDARNASSYPDAMEGEDGYIYIVYDRERGAFRKSLDEVYSEAREVLMARITEEDILAGELTDKGSYLGRIVTKLGTLAPEDGDPFRLYTIPDDELAAMLIEHSPDDPITRLFELFPLNCIHIRDLDAKRLDALVARCKSAPAPDMALLAEVIAFVRRAPAGGFEVSPIIKASMAYIEEHLAEDLPVSAIADQAKVSLYYLSHLFRDVTGKTLVEYRNECRIARAKQLLVTSDDSITSIAQKVGFSSSSYFTELFSASEKIPPSEYRRYHKH